MLPSSSPGGVLLHDDVLRAHLLRTGLRLRVQYVLPHLCRHLLRRLHGRPHHLCIVAEVLQRPRGRTLGAE